MTKGIIREKLLKRKVIIIAAAFLIAAIAAVIVISLINNRETPLADIPAELMIRERIENKKETGRIATLSFVSEEMAPKNISESVWRRTSGKFQLISQNDESIGGNVVERSYKLKCTEVYGTWPTKELAVGDEVTLTHEIYTDSGLGYTFSECDSIYIVTAYNDDRKSDADLSDVFYEKDGKVYSAQSMYKYQRYYNGKSAGKLVYDIKKYVAQGNPYIDELKESERTWEQQKQQDKQQLEDAKQKVLNSGD